MNLVIFDVVGKMAHFRKYYTNSSSLTYYFPPRTALTGLISGIIGKEKDTYYELFSSDKARIAISIKASLRKIVQTVNYIWAGNPDQLNGSKGVRTQIPLEIVVPASYEDDIRYRVFFSHNDQKILEKVYVTIKERKLIYPPYLGISEFTAKIEFVDYVTSVKERKGEVVLDSVLNTKYLQGGRFIHSENEGSIYVKEMMPFEFDKERHLINSPAYFIVEILNGKIRVQLDEPYYRVSHKRGEENIVFME